MQTSVSPPVTVPLSVVASDTDSHTKIGLHIRQPFFLPRLKKFVSSSTSAVSAVFVKIWTLEIKIDLLLSETTAQLEFSITLNLS